MIIQSAPLILKQRNQVNRECLYAWYPEVVPDTVTTTSMAPRDIYINRGIDKDLIQQNASSNGLTNNCNNNDSNGDVVQRYKQSIAPSERIYHSVGTIDEALQTPWALHYEISRRPATPNLPSHSTTDIPIQEEIPRRLKSAPLIRSLPPTSILTVPEVRFITPIIAVPTNQISQLPPSSTNKPRSRASSAKARLNTTVTFSDEQKNDDRRQQRRESKSAQRVRSTEEIKPSTGNSQNGYAQVYADVIQQPPVYLSVPPSPQTVYVYEKAASWCGNEQLLRPTNEINRTSLNPHYFHRRGVVSANNMTKKAVIRENSTLKKSSKHHRRHHHHSRHQQEKRNEPLLAFTPISQSTKLPFEIDGVKLFYDPTLAFNDPSSNLKKYLIEGRLYLIKDQRYNVVENIDSTVVETYNRTSSLPPRPKYYQTIPVEKLQIPKPPPEAHYNASETFFYNTIPKRVHRYVIDPNFISENLNVNKMSLSQRPSSATVVHSTVNDINRQPATIYA